MSFTPSRVLAVIALSVIWAQSQLSSARMARDPRPREALLHTGSKFRDCIECPEMVVVPPGHFKMGAKAPADGQEGSPWSAPAREVTFDRALAVGVYDVTRGEYSEFVRETNRHSKDGCYVWNGDQWVEDRNRSWRNPGFRQTPIDPVVCVNWEDAQAYVRWLNIKLGDSDRESSTWKRPYRLPTLAEAEFAAGANETTAYFWGDQPDRNRANFGALHCRPCGPARQGKDRWLYTSPVGSFRPNRFGLYDVAGNVYQWTDECWPNSREFDCIFGVVRGGSWLDKPEYLLTGEYQMNDRINHNSTIGFRVVRDIDQGSYGG